MADLGAYKENVKFSRADAEAMISASDRAASTLSSQYGSRQAWRATGATEFQGYFSELFQTNGSTQLADSDALAGALRTLSSYAAKLRDAADAEQKRRVKAREWEEQQKKRNGIEQFFDGLFGDTPPVGPPAAQLKQSAPTPPVGPREVPQPGSGGGSASGTSSAVPENLRSFASSTAAGDQELAGLLAKLQSAYAAFSATCQWGHLDAGGVIAGFLQYQAANDREIGWANTLAAAFELAGGSGAVRSLSNQAIAAALASAGVAASRSNITIDMPSVLGGVPTSGYADDPVNTATGNFTETETDLAFGGGVATLVFDRTYNSADPTVGGFGPGWSSWTQTRIRFSDTEARWVLPDGRNIVFPRHGDGWERAVGANYWLELTNEADASTDLVVSDNAGGVWRFTAGGRLESVDRGSGTRVDVLYSGDGRLAGLAHERGRSVMVEWDGDRVAAVLASDGRRFEYEYDGAGRLVRANGPSGSRSYGWGESGLIEQVIDGDGVVELVNGYDLHGRVAWQRSPFGRTSRYTYLPGGVTEVADEDGTRANTWIADPRGRLIGVIDSDGNRQSTSWDRNGNMVLVTDREGAATIREYDPRGHLIRQVTPEGADLEYGYDELDRVTTVIAGSDGAGATAFYEYDGADRNPSLLVDPAGGRTRMVWERGLLAQLIDPTGVTITFSYDEHGDLTGTTNAAGDTARFERDAAGRVIAAIPPLGHRTTYRYDSRGLLTTRHDPDGAIWRYEYTTAGRLAATVAPDGGRTTVEYGSHGEEIRTIDSLGRAITRVLDDLGNVAKVELPDGSAWQYSHDALSRLVATTDPARGVWSTRYDKNGTPTATIDPTGVTQTISTDPANNTVTVDDGLLSSTLRLDRLGRPVQSQADDGSENTIVYDACGRPVEVLDPDGALTLYRRDPAGRLIEHVDPTGATTRFQYDPCGRLA
ncbi:MAG: DUF6531 domain-containing protein, partial [Leifsonia sp.]